MKYKLLITLLITSFLIGFVSADCRTNWLACTGNITLPTDNQTTINSGLGYLILRLDSIGCNATYCADTSFCKNAKEECLVTNDARTLDIFITNSTNTTNGATYSGPYFYNGGEPQNIIVLKRITCLEGCESIVSKPVINICVNNSLTKINNGQGAVDSPPEIQLTAKSFNQYYNRYWTFRDENSGLFNFSANNAVLTGWCQDYSQFTLNLTTSVDLNNTIWLNTLEQPKYFLTRPTLLSRVRQDSFHILADSYYVPASDGLNYTFTLNDYTGGQFYKSVLTIIENVNDTLGNIYVEQFDESNVLYANLKPNTQYSFKITSATSTRDLGAIYLDSLNLVRSIVVSRPDMNSFTSRWDGLNISITSNYNASTLNCLINSATQTNGFFTVYSTNTTPYTMVSNSSSFNIYTATFNYAANRSIQYYTTCYTIDTVYGLRQYTSLINFQNTSQYYGGFGTLNVPATIFGIGKTKFLNLISVTIALVVAGLFSAISMGTGAIVFGMVIGLFYFIGYFITSPMTIGLIIFLAIMIKLSENRFGVVT
jgi:hypothetical protein